MSTDYEINLHLEGEGGIVETILRTHDVLERHGIVLNDESTYLLYDESGAQDFDFEPVKEPHQAFERLAGWAGLGTIDYWLADRCVTAAFSKGEDDTTVRCVGLSCADNSFDGDEGKALGTTLAAAVTDLHQALRAMRTIWAWGLDDGHYEYDGYKGEIECLEAGKVSGLYWLDILRGDLVTDLRRAWLRSTLQEHSVLTDLPDGSLYYRQTETPFSWYTEKSLGSG